MRSNGLPRVSHVHVSSGPGDGRGLCDTLRLTEKITLDRVSRACLTVVKGGTLPIVGVDSTSCNNFDALAIR